ncbi:LysM peptidoglycan-binding domain-containing protein [Deinococcus radiodurans]|nr:LysM peptidoglycan-binding domain-containing protein [Deinococcus radiodurans]ANC72758.1 cell wall protein [Deinococcus radiodurans R1 = ATCC 13939 = DSM 20539]QIP29023.1 LysM peptidoglycan-binding domain-containing protein [Deinococcus radiodurans]QIP32270.1 LysM peptidoglycan-binding domain-containing protein [Deinococcus radiodurans]UID69904.1 cell wall protein [Deinococcus radiodurans R1 = ATCC 13939 = DSM 20539]
MRCLFLSFILLLPSAASALAAPQTVVVRPGQTLYRIALQNGLSVAELQRLNGLHSTTIEVGQVLRVTPLVKLSPAPVKLVPAKPVPAPPVAAKPAPVKLVPVKPALKPAPTTYTVRRGDTLTSIGKFVGLRVEQLQRLNGLKGNTIAVGQVLRLTAPPTTYRVQPGDTLPKIGVKVGLRVEQLRRINGLTGDALQIGQVLRLTAPPAPTVVAKAPVRPAQPPTTYTVRRGDTLTSIGKFVGLRVEQLQRLNGLKDNTIAVGQVLRLTAPKPVVAAAARPAPVQAAPAKPAAAPGTYVVVPGDTLAKIGVKVGLRVEQLQRLNGLSGTTIEVGQVLKLRGPAVSVVAAAPAPARVVPSLPPGTEARLIHRYVRVGLRDNARTLAQTYGVTPEQLRELNGFGSTGYILPGMRVLVPQQVAVPVPPRPVAAPVTLQQVTPLGIPVQVVRVDLRWRSVLVTPVLPGEGLKRGSGATVSALAARSGARAVVNGSYFHPGTYAPAGDIVMHGRLLTWGRIPSALAITPDNRAEIREGGTGLLGRVLDTSWAGMETVIATGPEIVRDGVVQNRYSSVFRDPAVFGQAARSAIGLAGPRDLLLVTTHAKLSVGQMGQVMQALGARDALLLDGGSSAGMAWNGAAVLNSVRKVSYGIGVFTDYDGKRYSR